MNALRRMSSRSFVERRIILLLRGAAPSNLELDGLETVRELAAQNGWLIQDPGGPFISVDEALFLGWLAQFQRKVVGRIQVPADDALTAAIRRLARALEQQGLMLPAFAVERARLQDVRRRAYEKSPRPPSQTSPVPGAGK